MAINYAALLTEASQRLRNPRLMDRFFGWERRQADRYLVPHFRLLEKQGQVVWGAVVQANGMAYSPGENDLAANVVFSTDEYYDDRPIELMRIAAAVWYLKNKHPRDVNFARVASIVTNETNMVARHPLPDAITSGRCVYLTSTLLMRRRLPGGILTGPILPLVVAPEQTEANMLLPLQCWPDVLREHWRTRVSAVDPHPAVLALEYLEPPQRPVVKRDKPFSITERACQELLSVKRQQRMTRAFVRLAVTPAGHAANLTTDYDPLLDDLVTINGLKIIWRKEFAKSMANTTLDFKQTHIGAGFVFLDS